MSIPVRKNSCELSIALASTTCHPGSTIIGFVQRRLPVVSPEATLTIQLLGCAKAKIYDRLGRHQGFDQESGNYSLSQYDFFRTNGPVEQTLHSGPLHIQDGGKAWQFSLTVPTTTGVSADAQEGSYLEPGEHELPRSFASQGDPHCVIEYFLEARLAYQRCGKFDVLKTRTLMNMVTGGVSALDWKFKASAVAMKTQSYRLVPGADSNLSWKQKGKQLLGAHSVPELSYDVRLGAPTTIQLDHEGMLPLKICFVPRYDKSSAELRGVAVPVKLESVAMTFRREISAEGGSIVMESKVGSTRRIPGSLGLERAFETLSEPITLSIEDSPTPVDIGAALKLQIRQRGLFADGKSLLPLVYPLQTTFKTYNIWVVHFMKYAVKYTVVGKSHEVRFEMKTEILPSTKDNEAPPPFDMVGYDAPPAFETAMDTRHMKTGQDGIRV